MTDRALARGALRPAPAPAPGLADGTAARRAVVR
jgi:hypothetical protein